MDDVYKAILLYKFASFFWHTQRNIPYLYASVSTAPFDISKTGLSNILGKSDLETDIVASLQQLLESTITSELLECMQIA